MTALEKNVPVSFSENFFTNGYPILIDIFMVSLQPCNSIIFQSSTDTVFMHSIYSFVSRGGGSARVLGKLSVQCRGVLLIWIIVGQGPFALAESAVVRTFSLSVFSFSLSGGRSDIN